MYIDLFIYIFSIQIEQTVSGPANNAYIVAAVDCILNIHRSDEEGHILVFLTGQEEVERACNLVRAALREDDLEQLTARKLVVLPLYAALSNEQQKLIFQKLDPTSAIVGGDKSSSSRSLVKPPRKWYAYY